MAKLNQTQRNYFTSRVNQIQLQKLKDFQDQIKAEIPNLDLTFDDKKVTIEAIEAGRATLKDAEEILTLRNSPYNWNFHVQISELFNITPNAAAREAREEYDRRTIQFQKAQVAQAARFNDVIMLGNDEAALAALSRLETETLDIPE